MVCEAVMRWVSVPKIEPHPHPEKARQLHTIEFQACGSEGLDIFKSLQSETV